MSSCPQCRAALAPHARFCSECGAWIAPPPPAIVIASEQAALSGTLPASSITHPEPLPGRAVRVSDQPPRPAANADDSGPVPTAIDSPRASFEPLTPPTHPSAPPSPHPVSPAPVTPQSNSPPSPLARSTMFRTAEPATLGEARAPMPAPPPVPMVAIDALAPVAARAPSAPPPKMPSANPPPFVAPALTPAIVPSESPSRAPSTLVDRAVSAPGTLPTLRTSRPLAGFLVSYQYESLGSYWPLGQGANLVGRAQGRPDLDVAIADATISSEHAVVTIERDQWLIEDRRSRNGTFVNGLAVAAGQRAPLRHGDRVRLGSFDLTVVVVPATA